MDGPIDRQRARNRRPEQRGADRSGVSIDKHHHNDNPDIIDDHHHRPGLGDDDHLPDHHDHVDNVEFNHLDLNHLGLNHLKFDHVDDGSDLRVRTARLLALHRPG